MVRGNHEPTWASIVEIKRTFQQSLLQRPLESGFHMIATVDELFWQRLVQTYGNQLLVERRNAKRVVHLRSSARLQEVFDLEKDYLTLVHQ